MAALCFQLWNVQRAVPLSFLPRKILIYNDYKKIMFIILTLGSPDDNILLVLVIKYQIILITGKAYAFFLMMSNPQGCLHNPKGGIFSYGRTFGR
ncbi:hypothetical protein J3D43_004168 [Paenibacillus xylanexedens]|nr:hypothetical protein [Paenibacillus xylanexedens]